MLTAMIPVVTIAQRKNLVTERPGASRRVGQIKFTTTRVSTVLLMQ